jgi:hypothetical protein
MRNVTSPVTVPSLFSLLSSFLFSFIFIISSHTILLASQESIIHKFLCIQTSQSHIIDFTYLHLDPTIPYLKNHKKISILQSQEHIS